MLVFDLPDYSKSSTAQNEKLVPERQGDGGVGGVRVGGVEASVPFPS